MTTFITKYKPYFLDDFDPSLVTVIKSLDENLLFVGKSNAGKTSLLYAIVRNYYGLGATDSFNENNILFINNLKEQGIHFFRNEMKTFCQSRSNSNKKKMIVIDDIDIIYEQSQQVFRNYMDKYKNIFFVATCTNIQKVIESIQSRSQILRIEPPPKEQLIRKMNMIIEKENIEMDEASKKYLLNSSIRELMTNLEKIYIYGKVDFELCKKLCSISFDFDTYIDYLRKGELSKAIDLLYNIHEYGYSVIDILDYFFTYLKTSSLTETEKYKIIPILCKYITIFHNMHEDVIELALLSGNIELGIREPTVPCTPLVSYTSEDLKSHAFGVSGFKL